MDYRIISIGALSHNDLWTRPQKPRTPHATCTLIRSKDQVILVDPGLPPQVIAARLEERSGVTPDEVTDVFLTNFRPAHRWGLPAFAKARWCLSEMELKSVGSFLDDQFSRAPEDDVKRAIAQDMELLRRCHVAPDRLAPQVDIFPLPGFTPGTCGLLIEESMRTILVAGDAVASAEHMEKGRVLRGCFDASLAQDSLMEAVEIADMIIPGHDNIQMSPGRRGG